MRVALLTDGIYPYVIGGMQKHSFFITKYLAKNKVYVDLYHCPENTEYDIQKLDVFSDEEKQYIRPFVIEFPPKKMRFPGHYLLRSYCYSEKIFAVLQKNIAEVDFIYCKGFSGWKLICSNDSRHGKFPPIGIKFHGLNMFQKAPSFKGWLEQMMFRPVVTMLMKKSDFVFSYGGKITEITKKIGIPDSKIIEIPTGIEKEWLIDRINSKSEIVSDKEQNLKTQTLRFLYIGRYERLKGIQELSEAINNLLRKSIFEFHFIGPIPEKLQIKNKRIKYHKQISSSDELKKIMDSCDVLVLPSYSEGMPNAIIEGMARGLAIIATDVGAVSYLVNDDNGILLERCTVKGIESAMLRMMDLSEEKIVQLKNNSLRKIKENFLWEDIVKKLITELEKNIITKKP